MTAEMDKRDGVSEVSNVEFERKSDLILTSCEDPGKVWGDCNGIVHDIVEGIDEDAKDDTDGSYVFVNGIDTGFDDPVEQDHDTDCVIDPTEASITTIASDERILSEFNIDPMIAEERQVQVQESRAEKGGNDQSLKEETVVFFSNHDVAVEDLQGKPDVDQVEGNYTVEEQDKTEVAESELQQLDHNVKVEDQTSIESLAAAEENLEFQDKEDERVDDQDKLGSATDLKENQKIQVEVLEAVEPELHQHNDGQEKVDLGKMELSTDMEDHQESEVMVAADVESNLDQEKEAERVFDEIPVEGSPGDLGIEKLKSEMDVCPVNGSDDIKESFLIISADDMFSSTIVVSNTSDGSRNMPLLNEFVSNAESLPCPLDDLKSETEVGNILIESDESLLTVPVDAAALVSEVGNESFPTCAAGDARSETEVRNFTVESSESFPSFPAEDTKPKPEIVNDSVDGGVSMSSLPVPDVNSKSALKCVDDAIDVDIEGDLLTNGDGDDKPICQEAEGIEEIHRDGTTQSSSPEGSTADDLDGKKLDAEVEKRPFWFLVKIPRYIDDKIRENIRLAQLQVDEKTQNRDAIRAAVQMKRVTCSEYCDNFEAAKSEEIAARDVLTSKRQEIDSVQTLINKIKNATSIEDIDVRIQNMEHMIEHETIPLKEEKQLIREIKQLKHIREQLSSNIGSQDELQQSLDQREEIEERFKLLNRELDSLRNVVLRTEGLTKAARKKYIDENEKLRELQSQFKAADDLRQQAYTNLQNLKKELYEKNKYFRRYKDDMKAASDYAIAGDKEALQRLFVNQVETVMDLWNKNDKFRSEYVRCNSMSTLRRLRTLDGRSLGPDEAPPILRNFVDDAVLTSAKINSTLPASSSSEQENPVLSLRPEKGDAISVTKVEQKNQTAKPKKPTRATILENGSATGSGREEAEQHNEEEHKRAKEEEALAKKAQELRKEEAAARLKEQRRLEEKAKAKEAEDRRKRKEERARARAELRAQKEAESREKERERRAKKKERKKEAAAQATTGVHEGESAENDLTESTLEPEIKAKPVTVAKRSQKPASLAKQTRTKPSPLPLRNRGKKRMQPWMWFLLAAMLVLVLFLVRDIGIFSKFSLPNLGF